MFHPKLIIIVLLALTMTGCATRQGYYFADQKIDPTLYSDPEQFYAALQHIDQQTEVVKTGEKYLGARYKYGGTTPQTGFDCSGFTQYVYSEALGMYLPRSTKQMVSVGQSVAPTELQPGDLLFFDLDGYLSHVAIYIGNGKFFHASSKHRKLIIADLHNEYFSKRFNSARRVFEFNG